MNVMQYWIFSVSCLLVSVLFLLQLVLSQMARYDAQQLSAVEQGIQRGQQSYSRWQQLATRTYQLSQTDAGLKDVIIRQQITVKPSSSVGSPPATGPGAAGPTGAAAPISNSKSSPNNE